MIHPIYSIYDYNENIGNTGADDLSSVQKAHICLHFCLFFATMQYDDLFMIDPVQSLHQMKVAIYIRFATFVTIATDF